MIKINKLEIENVKRVKATCFSPEKTGLTVIGGKNGQGKTSVLDAITWALGGERYRPSQAQRDGSVLPPYIHIVLSNGLVVERKGKNGDLKVIDPQGRKGGQQLLNEFVEELALNLPRFLQANSREKADTLLKIIGVGDRLYELENKERELYNHRHAIGQIADQKKKFAQELPYHPNAPKEPVSAADLIRKQQDILARNGENQRKRLRLQELERESTEIACKMDELVTRQNVVLAELEVARRSAAELEDESTAELERSIANVEQIQCRSKACVRNGWICCKRLICHCRGSLWRTGRCDIKGRSGTACPAQINCAWPRRSCGDSIPNAALYCWTSWNKWILIRFGLLGCGWNRKGCKRLPHG